MNVDTGELRRLFPNEDIPDGFVQLSEHEAKAAEQELGERISTFLPKEHPLRMTVTERVKKESDKKKRSARKAAKESKKRNRR